MRFKIKKKEVLFMIINIFIKLMYLNIIKKRIKINNLKYDFYINL